MATIRTTNNSGDRSAWIDYINYRWVNMDAAALELFANMKAEISNLTDRVDKLEKRKPSKVFKKPELVEIQQEFHKKGSLTCNDDGEAFYSFYESKGWMVGKTKMKCWKSSVNNWMRGKKNERTSSAKTLTNIGDTDW